MQSSQLTLNGANKLNNRPTTISEWTSSAYVRADTYVYRCSPNESVDIPIYAMQYGKPVASGTELKIVRDESQLQAQVGSGFPFVTASPAVATPTEALSFESSVTTDANGCAILKINSSDPGSPRNFNKSHDNPEGDYGIDGQVYGIRPEFSDTGTYGGGAQNQWDFISFLLWSAYTQKNPAQPTWYDDLQPIFQQYANLYPVMNRFLNLADYDSVKQNAKILQLAFSLPLSNPNSMPVTRDLSPAKRTAILTWLQNGLPLGAPPTVKAVTSKAKRIAKALEDIVSTKPIRGGKALAASRRLVHTNTEEKVQ